MKLSKGQYDIINSILLLIVVEGFYIYGVAMELIEFPGLLYTYPYLLLLSLLGVKMFIQKNTWKEWILSAAFIVCGYLSWKACGDRSSFLFMITICACKNVDIDKLIKSDVIVRLSSIILRISLAFIDIVPNNVNVEIGGRERTFFSWGHPNGMGMCMLLLCVEWIYVRHKKMRWYEYILIVGLVIFLDRTVNSRTSELVILVMLALEWLSTVIKKMGSSFLKYACMGSLILCIASPVIGIGICDILGNELTRKIGTMGSRFALTSRFLHENGITICGHAYREDVYDYLDMLFANCLLRRGVLFGLIVLILSILCVRFAVKTVNEKMLLILTAMFLFGVAEQEHLNLIYSAFPVLLGIAMWKTLEQEKIIYN